MAQSTAPAKKKEKKKGRIATWLRELRSELKKISWPTAKKVIKQLGVVLAVVAFFLVAIFLFDSLFAWLLGLLVA